MPDYFKILHSFNSGDLISILPGFKKQYDKTGIKTLIYQKLDFPAHYYHGALHSTVDDSGQGVCMNKSLFDMMRPLIIGQEYIEDFKVWQGESVDLNYDLTRESNAIPMPAGSIHHWPSLVFPEMVGDYDKKWIDVKEKYIWLDKPDGTTRSTVNLLLINRTQRYQNPYISYYFLKEYPKGNVMFIGTEVEHTAFNNQWGLDVSHLKVNNFLELAQAISLCKVFLGNQSFCWHLADAMKKDRILEICNQFPNTWPTSSNGFCFTRQAALEFYTNKLING